MIETKNAIYMHIPRTGGIWVQNVLSPIALKDIDHGLINESVNKPVIAFVRNPWNWHISVYEFLKNGSVEMNFSKQIMQSLWTALGPDPSFEFFLENVNNPSLQFRNKILRISKILNSSTIQEQQLELQLFNAWILNDISLYQLMVNEFTKYCTYTFRAENIRNDLIHAMDLVGDLNETMYLRALEIPNTNVSIKSGVTYDDKTYAMVQESCKSVIEKYGY